MKNLLLSFLAFPAFLLLSAWLQAEYYKTNIESGLEKKISLTYFGHASLLLEYENFRIYIDPYSQVADFSQTAEAGLILITHQHRDHFDLDALKRIKTGSTTVICNEQCKANLPEGIVLKNGQEYLFAGKILITAVPAYNIKNLRPGGEPFHPKNEGNGYIIKIENCRIYIAGDTENIPEMADLSNINYAFLPLNLPYTMNVEMFLDAVDKLKPETVFPYHTNSKMLEELEKKWPKNKQTRLVFLK